MKGLEFKRVLLCSIQDGDVPLHLPNAFADPAALADHDKRERSLFYVAATRARDELVITGYGKRSTFLSADAKAGEVRK
jgi:superfamily I DNA/RNA helicase